MNESWHDFYTNDLVQGLNEKYPGLMDEFIWHNHASIDHTFLCFAEVYGHLARLIPTDRVVYDFGCSYGLQAWFFRNHHGYVGIEVSPCKPQLGINQPNAQWHLKSIEAFLGSADIDPYPFAIINAVPSCSAVELVKTKILDCFSMYPRQREMVLPINPHNQGREER